MAGFHTGVNKTRQIQGKLLNAFACQIKARNYITNKEASDWVTPLPWFTELWVNWMCNEVKACFYWANTVRKSHFNYLRRIFEIQSWTSWCSQRIFGIFAISLSPVFTFWLLCGTIFPLLAALTFELTENSVRREEVGTFTPPLVCNLTRNRHKLLCFDSLEHQTETSLGCLKQENS